MLVLTTDHVAGPRLHVCLIMCSRTARARRHVDTGHVHTIGGRTFSAPPGPGVCTCSHRRGPDRDSMQPRDVYEIHWLVTRAF